MLSVAPRASDHEAISEINSCYDERLGIFPSFLPTRHDLKRTVEIVLELKDSVMDGLFFSARANTLLNADTGRFLFEEAKVGQGIVNILPPARLGEVVG